MFSGRVVLIVVLKTVKYEVYLCVYIYAAAKDGQHLRKFAQVLRKFSGCVNFLKTLLVHFASLLSQRVLK